MSDPKGQRIRSRSFAYKLLELSFHRKRHQSTFHQENWCSGDGLLPRLITGGGRGGEERAETAVVLCACCIHVFEGHSLKMVGMP